MSLRPSTNHARLHRLLALMSGRIVLPDDMREWLSDGIREFLDSGGKRPLCVCLGLRGIGKRSLATEYELRQRNIALREAARHIGGPNLSDWQRAQRLADLVASWPRRRRRLTATPAERLTPMERSLVEAFQWGYVPTTARQLFTILTETR